MVLTVKSVKTNALNVEFTVVFYNKCKVFINYGDNFTYKQYIAPNTKECTVTETISYKPLQGRYKLQVDTTNNGKHEEYTEEIEFKNMVNVTTELGSHRYHVDDRRYVMPIGHTSVMYTDETIYASIYLLKPLGVSFDQMAHSLIRGDKVITFYGGATVFNNHPIEMISPPYVVSGQQVYVSDEALVLLNINVWLEGINVSIKTED